MEYLENVDFVPKHDSDIAVACLEYLSLDEFTSGSCESEALLGTRLEKFPFLAYAARNWGEHVRSN